MSYTKTSLIDQNKILKKHFGVSVKIPKTLPELPQGAEHLFLIPSWRKIAETYPKAVQAVLDALKSVRQPFRNWQEGNIDEKHIHQIKELTQEIIPAQFGNLHKGESIEQVRKTDSVLLGAYEVGIMLLTHPDRLVSGWEGIDCPNDEWSPGGAGRFSESVCFDVLGGEFRFDGWSLGFALDDFGSASGFFPQALDSHPLETFGPLNLESAIQQVKEAGYQVSKIL